MNYLAHLHLAKVSNTSYCGNLFGDFTKQVELASLPEELITGIRNHQYVDKLVDNHPASIEFRDTQQVGRRRFVGIVQDVLMDYWLVNKWSDFSDTPLPEFHDVFLPDLLEYHALCPPRLQSMIESLDESRWLADLGRLQGIERALASIMRRWKYGQYLQPFYAELPSLILATESVFDQVYPYLVEQVQRKTV